MEEKQKLWSELKVLANKIIKIEQNRFVFSIGKSNEYSSLKELTSLKRQFSIVKSQLKKYYKLS